MKKLTIERLFGEDPKMIEMSKAATSLCLDTIEMLVQVIRENDGDMAVMAGALLKISEIAGDTAEGTVSLVFTSRTVNPFDIVQVFAEFSDQLDEILEVFGKERADHLRAMVDEAFG